jgi:hypothetical protein
MMERFPDARRHFVESNSSPPSTAGAFFFVGTLTVTMAAADAARLSRRADDDRGAVAPQPQARPGRRRRRQRPRRQRDHQGTGTFTGTIVFVAANSDELWANVVGGFISPTTAVGQYAFVGGTGRFAAASGDATFQAESPDGIQLSVRFVGTLSAVGP